MPQTAHIERHFTGTETVRDIVIGMSDGLTVPFGFGGWLDQSTPSADDGASALA